MIRSAGFLVNVIMLHLKNLGYIFIKVLLILTIAEATSLKKSMITMFCPQEHYSWMCNNFENKSTILLSTMGGLTQEIDETDGQFTIPTCLEECCYIGNLIEKNM